MLRTKQDVRILHSEKCKVEAVDVQLGRGAEHRYLVAMSLAPGEILTLHRLLNETNDEVGQDLAAFLNNALERAGIKT